MSLSTSIKAAWSFVVCSFAALVAFGIYHRLPHFGHESAVVVIWVALTASAGESILCLLPKSEWQDRLFRAMIFFTAVGSLFTLLVAFIIFTANPDPFMVTAGSIIFLQAAFNIILYLKSWRLKTKRL